MVARKPRTNSILESTDSRKLLSEESHEIPCSNVSLTYAGLEDICIQIYKGKRLSTFSLGKFVDMKMNIDITASNVRSARASFKRLTCLMA